MLRRAFFPLLVLLLGAGCARQVSPSGGEIPETPMQVIASTPDTFAVVDPFDGWVRFTFDRRLSERPTQGGLRDAVVVSPRSGPVQVRHRRDGIDVRMEGGFTEHTVYRVTLLPTLQDLWRNQLIDNFDLFFSTGPAFEPNVLGGFVIDRLTGEEAAGIRVDVEPVEGGPLHSTVTDSLGIFTFPYLPADRYRLVAYEDRNRNRAPDFTEPQDSLDVELAAADTLILTDLALLLPDTTAAVLQDVVAVDSITLRLLFDDPIDPGLDLETVQLILAREEGDVPATGELLHRWEWDARLAAEAAAQDPDDPDEPPPPPTPEPEAIGPPLPAFEFVVILESRLEPEVVYEVTVAGLLNLNGVPGGGGTVEVEGPPEPDDPGDDDPGTPPDTTSAAAR